MGQRRLALSHEKALGASRQTIAGRPHWRGCSGRGQCPLPAWLALIVGLVAAAVLGYMFPADAVRVGIMAAIPILSVGFLVGLIRGISVTVIIVFLACSLILPVSLAKLGAGAREGKLGS